MVGECQARIQVFIIEGRPVLAKPRTLVGPGRRPRGGQGLSPPEAPGN